MGPASSVFIDIYGFTVYAKGIHLEPSILHAFEHDVISKKQKGSLPNPISATGLVKYPSVHIKKSPLEP